MEVQFDYEYNAADQLIEVNRSGETTLISYDKAGRKTALDDPDLGDWSYSYDALGNLAGQTDGRGCIIALTYDALNRLTGKSFHPLACGMQTAIVYTYDAFDAGAGQYGRGYRTGMTDGSGSSSWVYDSRGRVTQETQVISGSGTFTTQWGYNSADQVSWMIYPADASGGLGEQVNYTYHPQGALDTLINSIGTTYVRASEYDAAGRLDYRQLGDSGSNFVIKVDYTYYGWWDENGQGRLQQIKSGVPGSLASLQDLRYTYDALGNVLTIQDYKAGSPQTQTFAYDDANRLTSAQALGGSGGTYTYRTYVYDASTGNPARMTGTTFYYDSLQHAHAVTSLTDGRAFTGACPEQSEGTPRTT